MTTIRVTVRASLTPVQQAAPAVQQALAQGVVEVIEDVATRARRNAPVDTGVVRGAIATKVGTARGVGGLVRGTVYVGSQAPYAQAVDEGSRPHWAPIAPLKRWAARKLGDERAAYAVRWAIARRGTRPTHFMRNAIREVVPRATRIINGYVSRALAALR